MQQGNNSGTHYVGDAEIRVHLVFQDYLYHPKTYHPLPWHGLCTPEERRIRLAVAAHEGAMGPLRLDQASIVTTAHEMMHLVQHHRGDPLVALLSDDGSISSDYYAHPHEREAWDAGLHALKAMIPSVQGHVLRPNGDVLFIPDTSRFSASNPYRIRLLSSTLRERVALMGRRLFDHAYPFEYSLEASGSVRRSSDHALAVRGRGRSR